MTIFIKLNLIILSKKSLTKHILKNLKKSEDTQLNYSPNSKTFTFSFLFSVFSHPVNSVNSISNPIRENPFLSQRLNISSFPFLLFHKTFSVHLHIVDPNLSCSFSLRLCLFSHFFRLDIRLSLFQSIIFHSSQSLLMLDLKL